MHELIVDQAARRPEAVAVRSPQGDLTYGDLVERSALLAARLRACGVGPDVLVAVCLGRSADLVVALLGVLSAGGAYVPLDPTYPPSRLAQVLADAAPAVLVESSEAAGALVVPRGVHRLGVPGRADPTAPPAPVEDQGRQDVDAAHLAYVVYTSGTTGEPKGVMVSHGSLSNLVGWHLSTYRLGPEDRTSWLASPGFDATVWEVWPTLVAGSTLHLPTEEDRLQPDRLWAWLLACGIDVAFLPTPLAEEVLRLSVGPAPRLRHLLTGGDRLSMVPSPGTSFHLVNHYGPTEATVVTTCATIEPEHTGPPPIGWPIAGAEVHVLDEHLDPVPDGAPGHLYVSGAGLARGYAHRPGQTAASFLPNPRTEQPGSRLYRTGDLVRRRADGALEYLGRLDHQVKVRGFRVELTEIEHLLREHPAVRDALVVARTTAGGATQLVGYLTTQDGALDVPALRAYLREHLPGYMLPAHLVQIPRFPLTTHGKIDLAALPDVAPIATTGPRDDAEHVLAGIWAEVLETPDAVDVHTSLFDLGGHSLLAHRVMSRVQAVLGLDVDVRTLFAHPSIAELAQALREREPGRLDITARLVRQVDALSDDEVAAQLQAHGSLCAPEGAG